MCKLQSKEFYGVESNIKIDYCYVSASLLFKKTNKPTTNAQLPKGTKSVKVVL